MIPATTTKPHKRHADHDDQHAAGKETTAARKPPHHDAQTEHARTEREQTEHEQTEHEQTEHEHTEREGSKRYRWDDPEIQARAAKGAVPDAALAARLGRMLGLARRP